MTGNKYVKAHFFKTTIFSKYTETTQHIEKSFNVIITSHPGEMIYVNYFTILV